MKLIKIDDRIVWITGNKSYNSYYHSISPFVRDLETTLFNKIRTNIRIRFTKEEEYIFRVLLKDNDILYTKTSNTTLAFSEIFYITVTKNNYKTLVKIIIKLKEMGFKSPWSIKPGVQIVM